MQVKTIGGKVWTFVYKIPLLNRICEDYFHVPNGGHQKNRGYHEYPNTQCASKIQIYHEYPNTQYAP